ncbi:MULTISPECIES: VanZ family protein [unclassified Cupriavidus]|uniref:VanZ family protein n=1 Tax=unclassified Cupriavidus TaxID=2640874 RepID=UPI001CED83A2|nr:MULTISPECIES: VanZ family protein [unclassified Cupriavidus]
MIRLTTSHYRVLFALCALAVLVLSLLPPDAPEVTTGWDKANHLLAFGTLAVLGVRAWPARLWHLVLALTAYGGAIEILQSLTSYRDPSWADLLADVLGIAVGLALSLRVIRA